MQNHSKILKYSRLHLTLEDNNFFLVFSLKKIYLFEENKSAKHGRFLWIAFEEMGKKYLNSIRKKIKFEPVFFLVSKYRIWNQILRSHGILRPLGNQIHHVWIPHKVFLCMGLILPESDPAGFDISQNLFPRSLITSESDPAIYKIYHKRDVFL